MITIIQQSISNKRVVFFYIFAILCLCPIISSPIALIIGFLFASLGLVPKHINSRLITKHLLAYSIVGLGFSINLQQAISVSSDNLMLIIFSILMTLTLGVVLTRLLKINSKMGYLIASGTAICGGSAIATVAPAIDASVDETSHALAIVFILNSVALFVFPLIGHYLAMSQHDFGLWSAIAIHDTSSVIGAASLYGDQALQTATTLKLARALWIVPVAFISAFIFKGNSNKITIPAFIVFYCLAIIIAYLFPQFDTLYQGIFTLSKRILVMCLFFMGAGLTIKSLKSAGIKPFLLGISLWLMISLCALLYILYFM